MTQLQREGRIFKRLHHPVDTRYSMDTDDTAKVLKTMPSKKFSDLF